jgi:osmoprotectant transport system ATP-binding protein
MITVESVSKSFNHRSAVDDISFVAHEKEILVLLGTSGCGKTTTLKMINRLIDSDSGDILIDGKNIKEQKAEELRMGIGYVMQNSGLFLIIPLLKILPLFQSFRNGIQKN